MDAVRGELIDLAALGAGHKEIARAVKRQVVGRIQPGGKSAARAVRRELVDGVIAGIGHKQVLRLSETRGWFRVEGGEHRRDGETQHGEPTGFCFYNFAFLVLLQSEELGGRCVGDRDTDDGLAIGYRQPVWIG